MTTADPETMQRAAHWQTVYTSKRDDQTSWYETQPEKSLMLIRAYAPAGSSLIDVGGGTSTLGARLAIEGYRVTVMDIAAAAIDRARQAAGDIADQMTWLVGDITQQSALGPFDLWHDRAVFHFLTAPALRTAYIKLATQSIRPGGWLILWTFSLDGPEKCSGLNVQRYDAAMLAQTLGPGFILLAREVHTHLTPWKTPQAFTIAVFRRNT